MLRAGVQNEETPETNKTFFDSDLSIHQSFSIGDEKV